MGREVVRIEEMRLRIPGLSREEASALGQRVAELLAEQLPRTARAQQLGALNLRTSIPLGTPREKLPELIVQAIKQSLA